MDYIDSNLVQKCCGLSKVSQGKFRKIYLAKGFQEYWETLICLILLYNFMKNCYFISNEILL